MNYILPFTKYCKNFVWNIFHSLINYFFYIHVKNQHNINKNCYLFISRIGLRNRILINHINYGDTQYFKNMELKNIKLEINNNRKIPIIYIKNIVLYPKIFNFENIVNIFKIWNNANSETINKIRFIEDIYNELVRYIFLKSCNITINYKNFRIEINNLILTKNNNKIRIFIKKCKLFYDQIYLCNIKDLKISYDLKTDNINVYSKKVLIVLNSELIRNDVYSKAKNLMSEFSNTDDNKYPNIYISKIKVLFDFQNHMTVNIKTFYVENNIIKYNANIRLWKKDIIWIDGVLYNLNTNICIINDTRIRLFTSSSDKIYKSLRTIIKKYFFIKNRNVLYKIPKFTKPSIDISYCENLIDSVINSPNYINNKNINFSYISENEHGNYIDIMILKKLRIDFENDNGNFIFNDFKYSHSENGICLSCKRWLYFKDDIRYLDTLDHNDIIKFELKDNSMFIHTYKLYLNLDINQYRKTFSIFAKSIDRLVDLYTFQKSSKSYIFDQFYICSFRSVFSYSPDNIVFSNLLTGNYNELVNLLDLTNIDIILKDNTIVYPKDFSYILDYLMKNIIEDVIDNNFETIIKKTPVAMSYKIKKSIQRLPGYATKFYNIINKNLL